MKIGVSQTATHLELIVVPRSVTQAEVFPLIELIAGTPSAPQADAFALLDTLAVFLRGATLRKALVEVIGPSRNLWLLEHIDIWNYAIKKGMIGTRIAYVVTACTVDRDLIFAENYACKLGIMLKFFTSKSAAMPWLLKKHFLHGFERDSGAAPTFEVAAGEKRPAEIYAN